MPADANALSLLPSGYLGSHFIDFACHFVPRHPRILNSRPEAFFHEYVTVANTTGLHSNPYLPRTRFGNLALNYFETCSRLRNLCHLHRSYGDCCCHESSFEFVRYCRKTALLFLAERSTLLARRSPHLENDFQFHRGAERKACDAVHQAAGVFFFSENLLQQL